MGTKREIHFSAKSLPQWGEGEKTCGFSRVMPNLRFKVSFALSADASSLINTAASARCGAAQQVFGAVFNGFPAR